MTDFPFECFPRTEKAWGTEFLLVNNRKYCAKVLKLSSFCSSSYHYHNEKHETFIVIRGEFSMEINGKKRTMKRGDKVALPPKTKHRFYDPKDGNAYILEVSTRHNDADVVRLRKSKGTNQFFVDNSGGYQAPSHRMLEV